MKIIRNLYRRFKKPIRKIRFSAEFKEYKRLAKEENRSDLKIDPGDKFPILDEKTKSFGYDSHYVYHTAWAARVLQEVNAKVHYDIGSWLPFIATVSAFIPIQYFEFRPPQINLSGLATKTADLTSLHFADDSVNTLSCMHVLEHIGLGRYGDPIDPKGDLKAINELWRVLLPGGHLLVVVPVGKARVCFNAHRIYDPVIFRNYFSEAKLVEFAVVPDGGHLIRGASLEDYRSQNYACGMYHFTKE